MSVFILCLMASCGTGTMTRRDGVNSPIPLMNQRFYLDDCQIQSKSYDALNGDSDAAELIAMHFLMYVRDEVVANFWWGVAVSNGSREAREMLQKGILPFQSTE